MPPIATEPPAVTGEGAPSEGDGTPLPLPELAVDVAAAAVVSLLGSGFKSETLILFDWPEMGGGEPISNL